MNFHIHLPGGQVDNFNTCRPNKHGLCYKRHNKYCMKLKWPLIQKTEIIVKHTRSALNPWCCWWYYHVFKFQPCMERREEQLLKMWSHFTSTDLEYFMYSHGHQSWHLLRNSVCTCCIWTLSQLPSLQPTCHVDVVSMQEVHMPERSSLPWT